MPNTLDTRLEEGCRLDADELSQLLLRPEGPTLEFKREWYAIDSRDAEAKSRSRDELVKDVVSLANGSPSTAGDVAYLVIGASDGVGDDGQRQLFDAIDFEPAGVGRRILGIVSSASSPAFTDITFDVLKVESKRLGVITIHPTAHLHETTRVLRASEATYTQRTAFIRVGDSTMVASSEDREAISRHKRHRSKEYGRVSPVTFGAFLGAVLGATSGATLGRQSGAAFSGRLGYAVAGFVVFGLLGLGLGWSTRQYLEMRRDWYRVPQSLRWLFGLAVAAIVTWALFAFYQQLR